MCGTPLTGREDQEMCSPKCRAKRHRQARVEALAARDRVLRRLLAAARANLEAAERVSSEPLDALITESHDMPGKMARVIKARRAAKGWTQQELADRLKVNQSYIALLERGERTPSLPVLKRLAKALGVPVTALLE